MHCLYIIINILFFIILSQNYIDWCYHRHHNCKTFADKCTIYLSILKVKFSYIWDLFLKNNISDGRVVFHHVFVNMMTSAE